MKEGRELIGGKASDRFGRRGHLRVRNLLFYGIYPGNRHLFSIVTRSFSTSTKRVAGSTLVPAVGEVLLGFRRRKRWRAAAVRDASARFEVSECAERPGVRQTSGAFREMQTAGKSASQGESCLVVPKKVLFVL
jgi:hypothetical protein